MASTKGFGAFSVGMQFNLWRPGYLFYDKVAISGGFGIPVTSDNYKDIYKENSYVDAVSSYGHLGWSANFHNGTTLGNITKSRTFDQLLGTSENRLVRGSIYSDNILGANGKDDLAGNDRIDGRAGNDSLEGGAGADTLIGGVGSDTATYYWAETGVTAHLALRSANRGEASGDIYVSIENLTGSEHADRLYGDSQNNILDGNLGLDLLVGGAGND
ncbi:calcium-binding protein, partial [Rhizobiaceae sp. 2RAB30]